MNSVMLDEMQQAKGCALSFAFSHATRWVGRGGKHSRWQPL